MSHCWSSEAETSKKAIYLRCVLLATAQLHLWKPVLALPPLAGLQLPVSVLRLPPVEVPWAQRARLDRGFGGRCQLCCWEGRTDFPQPSTTLLELLEYHVLLLSCPPVVGVGKRAIPPVA